MNDIIERLHSIPSDINDVLGEAVDEIEGLRNEVEQLRSDLADARLMIAEWEAKANRRAEKIKQMETANGKKGQ